MRISRWLKVAIGVACVALVLLCVAIGILIATRPVKKEISLDGGGASGSLTASQCTPSAKLLNPCRPWIGAIANSYPGVSGWEANILGFEKRAARKVDVAHNYHSPTQPSLNKSELMFLNRGTQVYVNWKPDAVWRNADGRNGTVNGRIDQMATSIKNVAPKKIFLAVYHEPENDLSSGGSKCSRHVGNKGTTAEYRAMWKNVRKRFDAKGVNNVVWTMNYMGYSGWDCAVKDLWPGNGLVDWITWDPYTSDKSTFYADMSRFYKYLEKNSDEQHAFTSKHWGIGEMGYEGSDQAKAYKYYDDMATVITKKQLPRLGMYLMFDENGKDFGGDASWDSRIGYARSGKADATEQQRFNKMFSAVVAMRSSTPTPTPPPSSTDKTPPTVMIMSPKNKSTVSGRIIVSAEANDAVKMKAVTFRVDGQWVSTKEAAPYSFRLDTRKYSNGRHEVIARAWDASDNYKDTKPLILTIKN